MKKIVYLIIILLMVLPVSGCESSLKNFDESIEIKPAPIEDVLITLLALDPPQIQVYIKGGLPDNCTTFHDLKTERSVNIFKITVTVQRPRDAVCAEIYGYFEKYENLGSDFAPGETYIVYVNDKTTSFIMPELNP
jgi:hypothetical protein